MSRDIFKSQKEEWRLGNRRNLLTMDIEMQYQGTLLKLVSICIDKELRAEAWILTWLALPLQGTAIIEGKDIPSSSSGLRSICDFKQMQCSVMDVGYCKVVLELQSLTSN
jgi:hypothetical protein